MIKNGFCVAASVAISLLALALVFFMMPFVALSFYGFTVGGEFHVFLINLAFTVLAPWAMLKKAKDLLLRGLVGETYYRIMMSGIELNR